MPLKRFIDEVREKWTDVETSYAHPTLYLIVADQGFAELSVADREQYLASRLSVDADEISQLVSANNITLVLVTPKEKSAEMQFLGEIRPAHHWIEFLTGTVIGSVGDQNNPRIVHFYGFKGGQGRSTVLAMTAKSLADDGYQVLAVDADIEAPSLPTQFSTRTDSLESTLLGCIQYGLAAAPQQVYVPRTTSGRIDLLACKPSGADYDLDLAIFALNAALDPSRIQSGFASIVQQAQAYDVILVDHRSGISSSILPLVRGFPGPVVVCVRLDEQSDEADGYLRVLLESNSSLPGMFVSFSLDPEETEEKLHSRSGARIEALLDILAGSIAKGAQDVAGDNAPFEVTPDALNAYWISWFHDRSFLARPSPSVSEISSANRNALTRIRELADLSAPKKVLVAPSITPFAVKSLTNSGNTDEGLLIQTDALRRLRAPNSSYRYIFGRKGTGKTRLVKALVDEHHGSTLLSAEDFAGDDAISSADPLFLDLVELLFKENSSDKLWWIILDCALRAPATAFRVTLESWLKRVRDGASISTSEIANEAQQIVNHRVYFIDGIETAFTSIQMPVFVRGLFRFLAVMQSNPAIASRLTIRLFLRTDLAQFGSENWEQQVDGRRLTLSWDTQSIFNFALSRIAALGWFRSNFTEAVKKIQSEESLLSEGELSTERCGEILLEIFPATVRRNNLLTLTFLKTYFSEGEGETASYYPRIYDAFLRGINAPADISPEAARLAQKEDNHVGQDLIIKAHDYASAQYLRQVADELKNLVRLSDDSTDNDRRVANLLSVFKGLPTPFLLKNCLKTVHDRLSSEFGIDSEIVKSALEQMKQVGIFEERPGWDGWWRAGRLFKNALGMKYVR